MKGIEESVAATLRGLPLEKQQEVLYYACSLKSGLGRKEPPRSLHGLLQGLNVSEADIATARKELWGDFPGTDSCE